MWTKRNDHAPKSECGDFFEYMSKRPAFITFKFDHSLVFSCLHILFPNKNIHKNFIGTTFFAMGPCLCVLEHLFCLSHHGTQWTMLVDNIVWGPQTPWSLWHLFLGVNWSAPGMSSIANHQSYKAFKQLHGPWCTVHIPWAGELCLAALTSYSIWSSRIPASRVFILESIVGSMNTTY